MIFKEPEEQLALWLETLQDYDFEVSHQAGSLSIANKDSLSWQPCEKVEKLHISPSGPDLSQDQILLLYVPDTMLCLTEG